MPAKIVVACGSGVATSEMVAAKIEKLLRAAGSDATVCASEVSKLKENLEGACAFVSVVSTDEHFGIPVVNGAAFLTGMNQEEVFSELLEIVRKAEA